MKVNEATALLNKYAPLPLLQEAERVLKHAGYNSLASRFARRVTVAIEVQANDERREWDAFNAQLEAEQAQWEQDNGYAY